MYNKHEIMVNAWSIRKTTNVSMSTALKAAWALAKVIKTAEAVAEDIGWNTKIRVNDWARAATTAPISRSLSIPMLGTSNAPTRSAMSTI